MLKMRSLIQKMNIARRSDQTLSVRIIESIELTCSYGMSLLLKVV